MAFFFVDGTGDDHSVFYGLDHAIGYFIALADMRLYAPQREQSSDFMKLCHLLEENGEGIYFKAHTGGGKFGYKVSLNVMSELWTTYGVSDHEVEKLDKMVVPEGYGASSIDRPLFLEGTDKMDESSEQKAD